MRNVEVGILFAVATLAERGMAEFRIPIGQRYLMAIHLLGEVGDILFTIN